MNDIILTALINLFALCGALARIDRAHSERLLKTYLTRFFGIRSYENYLELYSQLRDVYEDTSAVDQLEIIGQICRNLQKKVLYEDQALMLLRLMEFTNTNRDGFDAIVPVLKNIASAFNIPDELYRDFQAFVTDTPSPNVIILSEEENSIPGLTGHLRILQIKSFNKVLFTYDGQDLCMNDVPVVAGTFKVWEKSSVLKGRRMGPLYLSNILHFLEKDKSPATIELCGRNVDFRFRNSENGIHDFSFELHSGQLVAIMGGSGVGKSTLLGLLNGNITPQTGSIEINGYPINHHAVKNLIGFVPQDDLLIEELSVYRNLYYTARLCFDDMPEKEIDSRINTVLSDLGLSQVKELIVGSPLNKTISGGQRKRLNIALELIREPGVLFLDEPTSGLSSTDSEKVINLLKEQTFKGRLIVVNIHQPSSDIYKLFDRLWLLDKGGYPVYDGNPIEAITYFKSAAFFADAQISTCELCGNVNPEIVLNIIDEKMVDDNGVLTEKRRVSPAEWNQLYKSSRKEPGESKVLELLENKQRRPSLIKQFSIFLQRNLKTKLANRQYLLIALIEPPLLALIVALLTRYSGEEGYSLMYNKNMVTYIFMAVIVATFLGMSVSAEEIIKDRALLKRERFLRLSRGSYLWSKIVFLFGLSLLQSALFTVVGNTILGIHDLFLSWWIVLFFAAFLANLTGLFLSQTLSSIVSIYISIPLLLIPQILLCGLVVKFDDLSAGAENNFVPIVGDIIPSRWAFEALTVEEFTNNAYNRMFFDAEAEKFTYQYQRAGFIYQLESKWETAHDKYLKQDPGFDKYFGLIRYNLPRVARISGLPPFGESETIHAACYTPALYESLSNYFAAADSILGIKSDKATFLLDDLVTGYRVKHGAEKLNDLKRRSHNLDLEKLVLNTTTDKLCLIRGEKIVPNVGAAYLRPENHCGRAAFYSHVKMIGNTPVPTFVFNLGIMLLMMLGTGILLFLEIPSRFFKKNET